MRQKGRKQWRAPNFRYNLRRFLSRRPSRSGRPRLGGHDCWRRGRLLGLLHVDKCWPCICCRVRYQNWRAFSRMFSRRRHFLEVPVRRKHSLRSLPRRWPRQAHEFDPILSTRTSRRGGRRRTFQRTQESTAASLCPWKRCASQTPGTNARGRIRRVECKARLTLCSEARHL